PVRVTYADVDVTNTAAQRGEFDIIKVSFAVLPHLPPEYRLLNCGGALGRGCGPLVLVSADRPELDLTRARVAIPGELTTAYLLFRLWAADRPPAAVEVVPFAEIMPAVAAGRYDAGLVLHGARFTFPQGGLRSLVDLGEWWERQTGLPTPLGAILAHTDRVDRAAAERWIRASVRAAWADPAASRDYVLAH